MFKNPYLIQRVNIRNPIVHGSFDEVFKLDYMGSAEFEFGAVPRSLTRVLDEIKSYQFFTIDEIKNYADEALVLFHSFSREELVKYTEFLKKEKDDKNFLKESTYFKYNITGQGFGRPSDRPFNQTQWHVSLWWDIENNVFFFFGELMESILLNTLDITIVKRRTRSAS